MRATCGVYKHEDVERRMGMVCLKASNPVEERNSRRLLFTVNRIDQGIRVIRGFH